MKFDWKDPATRYFLFRGFLSRMYLPILVIYMLDRGLSLPQIALITAAGQLASLIFEVPSGAIADTIGHRTTLVISLVGQALCALIFLGGNFTWILAASIGYYLFGSLMTGTSEALFFEYLKSIGREAEHLKLWGGGKSFARLINMFSVFVGGASYALSPSLPFIFCSVQFFAAALLISAFPHPKIITSVETREGFVQLLRHFPRALKTIWSRKTVFWLVVLNAILIGSIGGTNDFQQIIFTHLGATTTFVGFVYSAKRFVSMIMNSRAHKLAAIGPTKIMLLCTLLMVTYALVTPYVHSFLLYGLIVLMASCVYGLLEVLFNDFLNQAIPSISRATTISVSNFATAGVAILSASLFGWLHLPPEQTFTVLGIVILGTTLLPLVRLSTFSGAPGGT